MEKKAYTVLLVDDSVHDRLFMRLALSKNPRFNVVGELCDGEEAVSYLSGRGEFSDREKFPFPDVLLLDLKMPRKTGHEVLEWMRTQPFKELRVVVVSGSFLSADVARSRELGAHAYFKKDALAEEQEAMIAEIEQLLDHS
jgi:CheY-like chemotaxis protein